MRREKTRKRLQSQNLFWVGAKGTHSEDYSRPIRQGKCALYESLPKALAISSNGSSTIGLKGGCEHFTCACTELQTQTGEFPSNGSSSTVFAGDSKHRIRADTLLPDQNLQSVQRRQCAHACVRAFVCVCLGVVHMRARVCLRERACLCVSMPVHVHMDAHVHERQGDPSIPLHWRSCHNAITSWPSTGSKLCAT